MADAGCDGELTAPSHASGVMFVLHGHFYQPPREHPESGDVPIEPSAAPWHDWNARIASECYHPNTAARIVDGQGRVIALVDNYRQMSFNVGPTLLAWMEHGAPLTYRRIIEAGRATGGAIAQAFNHSILPLCNERDLRTQIRWGLTDFRHRFGYEPEGMWLPETAINDAVAAALVDEGVRFTILAPHQVSGRHGGPGIHRWSGDERLTLLVYDGGLSNEVAFGIGTMRSEGLIDRVIGLGRKVVAVATDGETFGHHHHYSDRALAHALTIEAPRRGVHVKTAVELVREVHTDTTVGLHESAWSCVHGVGRWERDCGCSSRGDPHWKQQWRTPLRAALDILRDQAAEVLERRGASMLGDVWKARDAYGAVVVGARTWDEFAATSVSSDPGTARLLLESQRHAMAMYTSCGWFFDDIAGIEARIVLRNAAALIRRLRAIGEPFPVDRFIETLANAEGNEGLDGDDVWREVWDEKGSATDAIADASFAPIVSDHDRAQELVARAVLDHTGLPRADLDVVARALGLAPGTLRAL